MAKKPAAKSHQALLVEQDKTIDSFIDGVSKLIRIILSKNQKDEDILEISEKFNAVKTRIPQQIVDAGRKSMWKYAAAIAKEQEEVLLSKDFAQEYADVKDTLREEGEFEKFPMILNKIKFTWRCFNKGEKAQVWEIAKGMISDLARLEQINRELNPK
jgi:hypothetical protein